MRRASLLLVSLLALLPACSRATTGAPVASARVITGEAIELARVRRAAVRFLQAYAHSPTDVEALRHTVVGDDLEEWVRWLEVQGRGQSLTGSLDLRRLNVIQVNGDQAMVAVDALVTFHVGGGGSATRRFESPMMLARQGGVWAVFDATRDGRAMQETISVLRPPAVGQDAGLVVEVESVFRFTPGTSVNVRVSNRAEDAVRISPRRSLLQVGGVTLRGQASSASLQDPIPAGGAVEGIIEFPQVPLDGLPEVLGVAVTGTGTEGVVVSLPAGAFQPAP